VLAIYWSCKSIFAEKIPCCRIDLNTGSTAQKVKKRCGYTSLNNCSQHRKFQIKAKGPSHRSIRCGDRIFAVKRLRESLHRAKCPNSQWFVGFEVLTAVIMKSTIYWDITLCSPLNVNRLVRGIYHLHLQGRRSSDDFDGDIISHLTILVIEPRLFMS
jgi:hypothetical protein